MDLSKNKDFNGQTNFARNLFESQFVSLKKTEEKGHGGSRYLENISDQNDNFEIEQVPKENVKEILFDGFYYDVTEWIDRHPGGDIIKFYTEKGEDATLAVKQFHHRSAKRVEGIMKSFKKRPATELEKSFGLANPETQKRHDEMTKDFTELFHQLESEGLFKPSFVHVALRIVECLFWGLMGLFLTQSDLFIVHSLGLGCLIMLSGRTGWLQHEGGHHSLTGWPIIDRFLQAGAFGLGSGLSSSWFSYHHQRHHAMPQRFEKDADLQTLPLLAFNKKVGETVPEKQGFFLQNQAALFIGVDTFLIGLYWRFYLHPMHTLKNRRLMEMFFIGIHYGFSYYIGLWSTFVIAFFSSIMLIGNISLSHLHFPLAKERLHWVEYALVHTTDITPSHLCDWWMGYLNYQIEHHLFPTMPQFRNHLIRDRVKALAAKYDIPYHVCTYKEAVVNCIKNLHHVASELKEE